MTPKHSPKSAARKTSAKAAVKSTAKSPTSPRAIKPRPAAPAPKHAPNPEPKKARTDPSAAPTSPTELSSEALEFINAIDKYKRQRGRPFPSWSEVYEIVKSLGYHKSA